jgi:hypothetical protein
MTATGISMTVKGDDHGRFPWPFKKDDHGAGCPWPFNKEQPQG